MHHLTQREILMLDENLRLARSIARFAQSCAQQMSDPQLRAICQQIAVDHQQNYQTLSRILGTQPF